jgi:hypothetical protein
MVAVAIGASAAIGAGSSIISGNKAANATKSAANANNQLQADIYNQNAATLAPFVGAGTGATEQLRRLLGLGDSNTGRTINGNTFTAQQQQQGAIDAFQQSAPYQAEFKSGQKAVTGALGAKGLLDSGAALKGLQSYGDQFLSSKLNSYEGQLASLAGLGQGAASAQAGVGQSYANGVSANNNNAANAAGNAALNTGNQINSVLGSAVTGYGYSQALGSSYGSGGTPPIYGGNLGGIY